MKSQHKNLIAKRKERAKVFYEKQQEKVGMELRMLRLEGKKQADDYVRACEEDARFYDAQFLEENYRNCIMAKRDELIKDGDKELANSLMSLVFKISTIPYRVAGNKELTERFANEYRDFKRIAENGSRQELVEFFFETFFEGKTFLIHNAEETAKILKEMDITTVPFGTIMKHNYRETYFLNTDGSKYILGEFTSKEKAKLETMVLKRGTIDLKNPQIIFNL